MKKALILLLLLPACKKIDAPVTQTTAPAAMATARPLLSAAVMTSNDAVVSLTVSGIPATEDRVAFVCGLEQKIVPLINGTAAVQFVVERTPTNQYVVSVNSKPQGLSSGAVILSGVPVK
jgi:hypothetical protein